MSFSSKSLLLSIKSNTERLYNLANWERRRRVALKVLSFLNPSVQGSEL